MSTSSVPTVLDALRAALVAYTGLQTVRVWSGSPGDMTGENIVLASDEVMVSEEALGLGEDDRNETYSIPCEVHITYANALGDLESAIKACRDRVYTIFGYVESYCNDAQPQTVSSTCRDAKVTGHTFKGGPYEGGDFQGRWAQIEFTIEVEAQKAP